MKQRSTGVYIVWALVLLLIILHQDNWLWNDGTLVFGFIPIGLFYHACISVAASATWFLATKIAWPQELAVEDRFENTVAGRAKTTSVPTGEKA